jgi:hypothetical protein
MKCFIHVSLVSSIHETSSCIEEDMCDALMEDCDAWQTIVIYETTIGKNLQVPGLVEL